MIEIFAALATSALLAAVPEEPVTIGFMVGTASFELPTPSTYCVPVGKEAAVAQLMAAGDNLNVTMVTLFSCKTEGPREKDYTLIKTPKNLLMATVSLSDLLANVGAEFDKPEFKKFLKDDVGIQSSAALGETIGANVKVSSGLQPLGKDDVCAYLGGTISITVGSKSYDQPVAACITVVEGRVLTTYRYGPDASVAGVAALAKQARALALTIRPSPIKPTAVSDH
jgi:hypothetical protein